MYPLDDTIAALATPPTAAARGIVRLSGPEVIACLQQWFASGSVWENTTQPTVFTGEFRLNDRQSLPGQLYLWPHCRSYTRQPSAEIHTIGSPPILQRLLANVCQSGARLAQPGEFTLRAFLAGRLDLTQAEAVLGVIDAESDRQLSIALHQLAGGVSGRFRALRDDLLNLLADLEAGLDFVEEDLDFITTEDVVHRLECAAQAVDQMTAQMQSRGVESIMPRVAIVGSANVGKSSLLNALARRQVAIVSDLAGTTRDNVTAIVTFDEVTCELVDTAGREAMVSVSPNGIAQRHSRQAAEEAVVRVICLDTTRWPSDRELQWVTSRDPRVDLLVGTKSDLVARNLFFGNPDSLPLDIVTSAQTREGVDVLASKIAARVARDDHLAGQTVQSTATRCRESLAACIASLRLAGRLASAQRGDELVAAEIRCALDDLGQVVGAVYTDDILDRIFSRFCIGK